MLFPYQETGAQWLVDHERAGLFDEQGLGKTAQAIVAARKLGVRRLLVVAPSSVLHNWQREIARWDPSRSSVVLTSSTQSPLAGSTAQQPSAVIVPHTLLVRPQFVERLQGFHCVILDEAHRFRKPTAKRTRAFYLGKDAVCRRSRFVFVLSGTPMANNPCDWWTMLAGLDPERLRDKETRKLLSYTQWRDRFCITRPAFNNRGVVVLGVKNAPELRERLKGFGLRRLQTQVLQELPPVRHVTVPLTCAENVDVAFQRENKFAPLEPEELLKMAQGEQFSTWRKRCGLAKVAPAAELIADDLESGVDKMVVFAHHREVLSGLAEALADYGPVCITGGQTAAARTACVDSFQLCDATRVCLVQIDAGGVGITLTRASRAVFVEQSFVPGDNAQAWKRIHRIGQDRAVLVRYLCIANSVDEVLTDVLARKTQMIQETMS